MSMAEESYQFTGLFEVELLLELMLRYWEHPMADDADYRQALIETGSQILQQSIAGTKFIEDLHPNEMNFVAAVWYAEWNCITVRPDLDPRRERQVWLEKVRRAVPSCFCSQDNLA